MTTFVLEHLWILGAILVVIVLLQSLVALTGMARHATHARAKRRLDLELLHHQIEAAKRLRFENEQTALSWNGVRKFEVQRKVHEGGDICSFYLVPHDRKAIPTFKPGQYLTFSLQIADQEKPTVRCYSLSDAPNEDYYRVSIKRVPPPRDRPDLPPGRSSTYFHEHVKEGDILDVRAPSGQFHIDLDSTRPVVLIGGGVGLTPMLSMLHALIDIRSHREIWFFYGVRNQNEHIMREHLAELDALHENFNLRVCYSNPDEESVADRDYHFSERISVDLFKRVLPSNNYEYYICGPPPMMNSLVEGLEDWGVPKNHVHFELFGPASVKQPKADAKGGKKTGTAPTFDITFDRSGQTVAWNAEIESLLEFAEENGIAMDCGCRAGSCGTCMTAIKSGDIEYTTEPGFDIEDGSCLTCICVPKGPLVLDA